MRVTLGYLLTAAGLGHICLGALLFFNASMMQTGNLLFVPGVVLTFGVRGTLEMCATEGNRRGTATYVAGLLLIRYVSSFVGFWLQCYAIFSLLTGNYDGFLSTLVWMVKMLPVVGPIFDTVDDIPWVKK